MITHLYTHIWHGRFSPLTSTSTSPSASEAISEEVTLPAEDEDDTYDADDEEDGEDGIIVRTQKHPCTRVHKHVDESHTITPFCLLLFLF